MSRNPGRNSFLPFYMPQDITIYVTHTVTGLAYRCSIGIDPDEIRNGFGPSAFGIEINEWPDFPSFAELIGGIIVMGGIQAKIPDRDIWIESPEFF